MEDSWIARNDPSYDEFHGVFLQEFNDMMDLYSESLRNLRFLRDSEKVLEAYKSIFRIFHTLKGTAAYFEDYMPLSKYSSEMCELYRDVNETKSKDTELLFWTRKGFTQLSSAYFSIRRGFSLRSYKFLFPSS